MTGIVLSVDVSLRMNLEYHTSAKQMWTYFEKRYVQSSGALRFTLLKNIHSLQQQPDQSVEEYYSAFTHITGPLESMTPNADVAC